MEEGGSSWMGNKTCFCLKAAPRHFCFFQGSGPMGLYVSRGSSSSSSNSNSNGSSDSNNSSLLLNREGWQRIAGFVVIRPRRCTQSFVGCRDGTGRGGHGHLAKPASLLCRVSLVYCGVAGA